MNRDQLDGYMKESGGIFKQFAGRLLGKSRLELEGRVQQATGRAQIRYGKLRRHPI
jgi:uncharacterized protein YjbJ (UPF0337 family)